MTPPMIRQMIFEFHFDVYLATLNLKTRYRASLVRQAKTTLVFSSVDERNEIAETSSSSDRRMRHKRLYFDLDKSTRANQPAEPGVVTNLSFMNRTPDARLNKMEQQSDAPTSPTGAAVLGNTRPLQCDKGNSAFQICR